MSTNRFAITISAVDKASKVFENINKRMSQTTQPLQRMGRSLGALGKEMHLPALAKGFNNVASSASKVAKSIGMSAGPMEALFGLGAAGSVAAVATGLAVLGAKVGAAGFQISQLSLTTGISTTALQRYAGAAQLMGGSADDMKESMANIGRSMRNAYYEGGPLLQFFNAAHIELRKTKDGAWDVEYALKKLAEYSARSDITPQAKELAASMVGYAKSLPQMMQGAKALEANAVAAEKLGGVLSPQAIKNAEDYTKALDRMKVAADGLGNTIGAKVYPFLEKMLRGIDTLANANSGGDFMKKLDQKTVGFLMLGANPKNGKKKQPSPANTGNVSGSWGDEATAPKGTASTAPSARRPSPPTFDSVAPFIPPPRSSAALGNLPKGIPVPRGLLQMDAYPVPPLPSDRDGLKTVGNNIAKFAPAPVAGNGRSVEDYLADVDKQLAASRGSARSKPEQGGGLAQPAQGAVEHTINVKFENAPRGMTVSNSSSSGKPASVKVARSMADIDS